MKKTFIALALFSTPLFSTYAAASDGTITFTGAITDSACTVDTSSASQTVNLGTVSSTAFSAAGDAASPTKFTISLTDCPSTVSSASVKFDGTSDTTNSSLLALGSSSTAAGLGIGLYEADSSTPVTLATSSAAQTLDSSATTNTLSFVAKYVATTSSVTAGTVSATSDFTVVYN